MWRMVPISSPYIFPMQLWGAAFAAGWTKRVFHSPDWRWFWSGDLWHHRWVPLPLHHLHLWSLDLSLYHWPEKRLFDTHLSFLQVSCWWNQTHYSTLYPFVSQHAPCCDLCPFLSSSFQQHELFVVLSVPCIYPVTFLMIYKNADDRKRMFTYCHTKVYFELPFESFYL